MSLRFIASGSSPWVELEPGARFQLLKADAGGVSTLTWFDAGARGAWHVHPEGEELFMLEGEVEIGGTLLRAGDYLETPAGEGHQVTALTSALMFVRLPKPPVYTTEEG